MARFWLWELYNAEGKQNYRHVSQIQGVVATCWPELPAQDQVLLAVIHSPTPAHARPSAAHFPSS